MVRHGFLTTMVVVPVLLVGCSRQPLAPDSINTGADTSTGAAAAASTHAATRDDAPVIPFGVMNAVPIAGAYSTLIRNDRNVTMTFHTTGLVSGNAYTVWWVIFNNPSACVGGCGLDDLTNPAVRASLVFATGHVVGNDTTANFGASLGVGDIKGVLPNPPSPAGPYGLENGRTAAIHLVVRSHGPADPQLLPDQINSFLGGCSSNPCMNVQASVHEPQ